MKNSYACIKRVEPIRRSPRLSVKLSEPVRRERGNSQSREDSRCDILGCSIKDIAFLLALFIGTGAVDYMLDSLIAAVIAIGSLAYLIWYVKRAPACGNTVRS